MEKYYSQIIYLSMKSMTNDNDLSTDFEKTIKKKYSVTNSKNDERIIDTIQRLVIQVRDEKTVYSILEKLARTIFSAFKFKEIIIGLKSKSEEVFRYEVFIGYMPRVEKVLREETYPEEYFLGSEKYKGVPLGKFTRYRMIEHQLPEKWQDEYEETATSFNALRNPRKALDEIHDGDEIFILMFGPNKELIGWIDLGLTIDGKLPSNRNLKFLELLASIFGLIIYEMEYAD